MAPELFSPTRSTRERSRVSHYEVVRKLGQGGMCAVYLARDLDLGRLVALKVLPTGFVEDAEKLARFHTEAKAISALNHPHIATIFAIEQADGLHYLVLEYLPGGTLRDRIELGKCSGEALPPKQAAAWGLEIAEGLAHAHRHEIVHRDVKAANILFTEEGRVKIADFGLAKILAGSDTGWSTATGCLLGTPVYMSPEQARGLPADKRSDVFSMGVLLFEMLTGRTPFHGPDMPSLLRQIVSAPAPPLREVRSSVDGRLAAVVERALAKEPAERYQDAGELARDLQAAPVTPGSDLTAAETVTIEPPRRRRAGWALAAAVLIAGLGVATAVYRYHPIPSAGSSVALPAHKRIAVLPFTNLGDSANQAVADGLMELVSNALTRLEQFHGALLVAPAMDVRRENVQSARDAGRVLGANLAILGSVQQTGTEEVQVFLNLVDTRTITQLKTETIRAGLSDLLKLQEGVVARVARMLELVLLPENDQGLKAGNTPVPAAHPHYVEGLGYLRRYDRPQNIDNAIAAFSRALAAHPDYVLAHDGAAQAYWRRYEATKSPEAIEAALEHASKALAIDDRIAAVHVTMGMIRAGKNQFELAEKELQTALRLDPYSADAYRELAGVYESTRREADAEATYRKAIELRKDDWWSVKQLGVFYFHKGRYAEAEKVFWEVIRLTPDSAKAYSNLGGALLAMGRTEEAAVQLERSVSIEPNARGYSNLGTFYFYEGRFADAVAPFEKASAMVPTDSKFLLNLADAYRWTPALAAKAPPTYRRALELIEKEIAVAPLDAQLLAKRATARSSLGEHRGAISDIEAALRLPTANGFVHFRASLVYEEAQRRDAALREVDTALRAHYRLHEILHAPELAALMKDPRFQAIVEARKEK